MLSPGNEYPEFLTSGLDKPQKLPLDANVHPNGVRANQWRYADYDGDGRLDLIVGVGDWKEYGWDNAFNAQGQWTRGPLHGYVYLLRNTASNDRPAYASPVKIEAGGKPVDVFGMPSPNLADFDGDGDLDLLCGEFVDSFTYFENVGTRTAPAYAAGRHQNSAGVIKGLKQALSLLGICSERVARPLQPLDAVQREQIRRELAKLALAPADIVQT